MGVFGDMRVGQSFQFDIGGGNWTETVEKVSDTQVRRADGRVLGLSFWTRVRFEGKPLVEVRGNKE